MEQSTFSTSPVWSLCIPTLASRKQKLARLLDVLLPQAEECLPRVEVLALHNNGERGLGPVKDDLLAAARGTYFSLVDDDDMIEPDYVPLILAHMDGIVDYIAFDHAYYENGQRHRLPVKTGLDLGGWYDLPEYLARDVTQINPMRTVIARQADFTTPSAGMEDWSFVSRVRALLQTDVCVAQGRAMYHYFHDSRDSNQSVLAPHTYDAPLEVDSPVFHWIRASS